MWPSYAKHFPTRILNSTHMTEFNIFFAEYVSRWPTFNFQLSKITKWLAKPISTKVSFKITIRNKHVYIDIRWPWIWNQYFYLGIWNDERTKIIILPSFQLVTRLNSQNRKETRLLMNSDKLICIWTLLFPFGIIQVSTREKWGFLLYFSSLYDYWPPSTLISLVNNSLGEMLRCEKRASQHLKMRKNDISWNIKTKCVADILLTVMFSSWRIILVIIWWAHKRQTFTLISKK